MNKCKKCNNNEYYFEYVRHMSLSSGKTYIFVKQVFCEGNHFIFRLKRFKTKILHSFYAIKIAIQQRRLNGKNDR